MLETALLFRNGMVIQRDKPVTVWGTAAPGAAVRVAMQNRTAECTADADGRWKAVCGPFHASFSEEMILSPVLLSTVPPVSCSVRMILPSLSRYTTAAVPAVSLSAVIS